MKMGGFVYLSIFLPLIFLTSCKKDPVINTPENIDSVHIDFRDKWASSYRCEAVHSSLTWDGTNWISNPSTTVTVTLTINKTMTSLTTLSISSIPEITCDSLNNTFEGYHTEGHFSNDSVYFRYQPGLAPAWSNYRGKKIP